MTHGTLKMKGVFARFGRFVDNETVLGLRFGSGINPPVLLPKWIIYGSRVRSRIDGETYRIWMKRMLMTMALILLTQVGYQFLQA